MSGLRDFFNPTTEPGIFTSVMSNCLKFGPIIIFPFIEVANFISNQQRGGAIVVFVVFFAICIPFAFRRSRWAKYRETQLEDLTEQRDALKSTNHALRSISTSANPHLFLTDIGRGLFNSGAWRLTLFERQLFDAARLQLETQSAKLTVISSCSSDRVHELPQGMEWLLGGRSPVSSVFRQNLADPHHRQAGESDAFVGNSDSPEWSRWRDEMLGGECLESVAQRSGGSPQEFPVVKFVWYGLQHPGSGRTLLLLAESASARGIETATLDHRATLGWTNNIVRISDISRRHESTLGL